MTTRRSLLRRRTARTTTAVALCALLLPGTALADAAAGGQNGADGQSTKSSSTGDGVPSPQEDWTRTLPDRTQVGGDEYEPVFDSEGHVLFQGVDRRPDPDTEVLVAIDRETGEVDWSLAGVAAGCGVAASDDGLVYGVTPDEAGAESLIAIDAADGTIVDTFTPQLHGEDALSECVESLRLADDGTLLALNSYDFAMHLQAFDTAGGLSPAWTVHYHEAGPGADDENTAELARPVLSASGDAVYMCREELERNRPDDGDDLLLVQKLDLATGTVVDEVPILENASCDTGGVVASPDGVVVGADGHGTPYTMFHIADAGNGDGDDLSIAWQTIYSRDADVDQSGVENYPTDELLLTGDTIVFRGAGGGNLWGVDLADGGVTWSSRIGLNSANIVADRTGNVYTQSHDWAVTSVTRDGNPRFGISTEDLLGDTSDFSSQWVAVGPDGGLFLRGKVDGDDAAFVRVGTAPSDRVAGLTRYDTAAQIALGNFREGVDTVFLATGTNFPDALTAGPLAAHLGAPVLLTDPAILPSETSSALAQLAPKNVVALGGTTAVTDEVLAQAAEAADGAAPGRLAGPTRYATAARIAEELPDTDTVYLAVGTNYPDTLAGGPATDGSPILLTGTGALPQETADALAARTPGTVIALGGPVAITDEVLAAAASAAGGAATDRLEGQTRYGTGVAIADTVVDDPGFAGTVFVAVGTNYPDAVSAASAASAAGAPIVLTRSDAVPAEVATWMAGIDGLRHVVVLGGTTAISDQVAAELASYVD